MIATDETKLLTASPIVGREHKCVLLVEDDRSLRRLLEIMLERAKYEYVSAGDGLEAIEALQRNRIDLVITDAFMPNLNGYELCRFMRHNKALAHIPIVLLSALEPQTGEGDQVDEFLSKPVSPEDFLACVTKWTSNEAV
jgi:two-component system cell cycle response regulator